MPAHKGTGIYKGGCIISLYADFLVAVQECDASKDDE